MSQQWEDRQFAWFLRVLNDCYPKRDVAYDGNNLVARWEWQEATGLDATEFDALFDRAWGEDFILHMQSFAEQWGQEIVVSDGYMLTELASRFLGFIQIEEREYRKQPIPAELRWAVWERDNFTCRRCGSRKFLSVDHIVAESKGGRMALDNLQTLCQPCNSKKGNR